jgi:restriction system protein
MSSILSGDFTSNLKIITDHAEVDMAIPDFQKIMLPLLEFASDGKDHTLREAIDILGSQFKLTPEEKTEMLPSGGQARFDNRVHWSRSYLKQAGLVENPARGTFRITNDGRKILNKKPSQIDIKFLMQFEKFLEFKNRTRVDHQPVTAGTETEEGKTPKELLEENHLKLRNELAVELLDTVKLAPPAFFENLVVELLVKMGYGGSRKEAGQVVGRSGDQGIDGIINEDRLGLDVIYLQAKRWNNDVNDAEIRNFVGSLAGHKASRGVFITTSIFTKKAIEYVARIPQKVILIDGDRLAQLMIEHGVGVSTVATYEVKKVDTDYFPEN